MLRKVHQLQSLLRQKSNASKLKEEDYVYVLQGKTDHQKSENLFTEFRWIGPYIVGKFLPNNNYLLRKNDTNKMQVLHRMQMRQYMPRLSLPDIRITPQERKLDPEVSLKHDGLYARAWECEYEKPIFDADKIECTPHNSP